MPLKAAAHEFFHAPLAVGLDHFVIGVAEEREVEFLLRLEIDEGFDRVGADAEDDDVLFGEFWSEVAEVAGLDGAAGRAGFWIEVEDDLFAFEVGERDGFAVVGSEREVGSFVANFQHFSSTRLEACARHHLQPADFPGLWWRA